MNANNTRNNEVTTLQMQRDYMQMIKDTLNNLYELRCQLHLCSKQTIKIEAYIKRTEELLREQHNFVNEIERKVLKMDFVKPNGRKYTGKEESTQPQLKFEFL